MSFPLKQLGWHGRYSAWAKTWVTASLSLDSRYEQNIFQFGEKFRPVMRTNHSCLFSGQGWGFLSGGR
jgi:hypothetical protein